MLIVATIEEFFSKIPAESKRIKFVYYFIS